MILNTFTGKTRHAYAAFDFETKTLVEGHLVDDATIRMMCEATHKVGDADVPTFPPAWWRAHAEVVCWAWIIYTPDGLAIAETFEEWIDVIQTAGIKTGWFYNAPFDFSILDYAMLSRGWNQVEKAKEARTYSELCNNFGARYSMTIVAPYNRHKGDRSTRTEWKLNAYDLRNILHGGLEKLLEDFDVRDENGEPIRKLEMDYQNASGASGADVRYMRNDAAGLWWLIDKAGGMLSERYGLDIRGRKPDVLTASGLAKRVFLSKMYPQARSYQYACWKFRNDHPMDLERDQLYREHGLLQGGLPVVNPDYLGKKLDGICADRYDVNSEYPYYMSIMRSLYSFPRTYDTLEEAELYSRPDDCYILAFSRIVATVKPNMVPCWRDPFTGQIATEYRHTEDQVELYIFREEWMELQLWYDFDAAVLDYVIVFPTRKEPAIRSVVLSEYGMKAHARNEGRPSLATFPKIVMNGFGGKYSQNPHHDVMARVLHDDGHVSLDFVRDDVDAKGLMHVVQGARITANGRVIWRKYARAICGDDVRKNLLYGDTDSIHSLRRAPDRLISPDRLGYLKRENKTPIVRACFLAPKTYYELEEGGKIELHAKGVRVEAIEKLINAGADPATIYTAGYKVHSLTALNVKGGKALLPFPKYIARPDDAEDETFF